MSKSAKKFLNNIHKSVNDDIHKMKHKLDGFNDEHSKCSHDEEENEFSHLTKK